MSKITTHLFVYFKALSVSVVGSSGGDELTTCELVHILTMVQPKVAQSGPLRPSMYDEDVELRRIFPKEFPQDTIRKSGSPDPEHLGRYAELKNYFLRPRLPVNSHFEELACYNEGEKKLCRVDVERYAPEEESFLMSNAIESYLDRRRVFCFMLLCFTEDELDRVTASF